MLLLLRRPLRETVMFCAFDESQGGRSTRRLKLARKLKNIYAFVHIRVSGNSGNTEPHGAWGSVVVKALRY